MRETDTLHHNFFADIRQLRTAERIGFIVLFVLLVTFTTISAYFQWQSILRDKKTYIELVGQSKVGQFKSWYDTQMAEARELSGSSVFIEIVADAVEAPSLANLRRIDAFLRPILRSYNYAESTVLTSDFHPLVSLTNLAKSDCAEVREKIVQNKPLEPFFTTLHLTSPNGKAGLHLIIPLLKEGQKQPFAYLVQTFFADDYLYPMLALWPGGGKTGETLLLERSGDRVQALNPSTLVNISAFSLLISTKDGHSVEARAGSGERGVITGKDYRGKHVFAAVNYVPELGWIILSKMDYAEAFSAWIPTLVILVVFFLVALAAIGTGSYVLISTRTLSAFRSRLALLKRTERSEALLSAILERVDAPVVIVDRASTIQFSNRSYKERFGDSLPYELESVQKTSDREAGAQSFRVELKDTEGSVLRLYVMPMHIVLKDQEALLGYVMRDVTELECALEQVQELNRDLTRQVEAQTKRILEAQEELRTIAAAISHNLAAPLRAVESFSEVLATRTLDQLDEEGADYVMRIRRASASMATLVDDLIILLSLDSAVPASEEFDFSVAAQEITEDIIKRAPKRRYRITIMPGLKVQGDRTLLKTAFRNVLEHAFQYCSDNTVSSIEIGRCGERGIFVKDNGIGMAPEEINAVLNPFSKTEPGGYTPGLSVGLTIAKKIVELHGGSLEIESAAGVGTTIRFKF